MTNASMTFGRPARLNIPRGSQWFASGAALLIDAEPALARPVDVGDRRNPHGAKFRRRELRMLSARPLRRRHSSA